jgi:hypothetical protein
MSGRDTASALVAVSVRKYALIVLMESMITE